jgi:hypothetical protein
MKHVSTRIPEEILRRLDEAAAGLAERHHLLGFTRSDAARAALERGLDVIDRELAAAPVEE